MREAGGFAEGLRLREVEPALSGTVRQVAKIQSGLPSDKAKEITKAVKDSKMKVASANSRRASAGAEQEQG